MTFLRELICVVTGSACGWLIAASVDGLVLQAFAGFITSFAVTLFLLRSTS